MPIRMTGLNSGLNTESIIAALMSAQRTKQTKIENKQTKLEWKKDLWDSLNTKIYNFHKNTLSKIKMQSTYKTKAANSSDSSKVTATASSNAATGTYKVEIEKLASAQNVTSGRLTGAVVRDDNGNPVSQETATSKTKLTDLIGKNGESTFSSGTQIKIKTTDDTFYLDVDDDTTIQDFVDKLKEAGLSATFDEGQQRFFINSGNSGEDAKFEITAGTLNISQIEAASNFKELVGYNSLSSDEKNTFDGIMNALQNGSKKVEDVLDQLIGFANAQTEKTARKKAEELFLVPATKEAEEDYNKELADKYNGDETAYLNDNGYDLDINNYGNKDEYDKAVKEAREKFIGKKADKLLKTDEYSNKIEDALNRGITNAEASEIKGETISDDGGKYIDESIDRTISSNKAIEAAASNYVSAMDSGSVSDKDALSALGLSDITEDIAKNGATDNGDSSKMVVMAAGNSVIKFNGATIESDSTTVSVAGIELNLLGETNGAVNITVTNDTSAIYDTIKDFFSEYNSILKEMNTYYNAGSARDYDVLSDEEKDAMSDSEVEKWESKIKDSLLRRDTTLGSIISSFKNIMAGSYTASNGKTYSLSTLGISTSSDYKEGGLFHIRGDEDDSEYTDKDNILQKMIAEDPDTVMEVITGLTSSLYSDLNEKMSATRLSSALTFYNDKEMSSQLSDYKKQVSKWESKLNDMEDRYYKQFSAMETALANLQSQQNSLASMLGS